MPMNRGGHLELINNLHVKSLGLFRRVTMGAVFLLNGNHAHVFAEDLQGNFFHEQADWVGIRAENFAKSKDEEES